MLSARSWPSGWPVSQLVRGKNKRCSPSTLREHVSVPSLCVCLCVCLRSEGFDKPGQHMLYELHCPGSDSHPTAEGLLPVRQTQVWDAGQLLPCVWDVPAFSGGEIQDLCLGFFFVVFFCLHFYVALLCAQNSGIVFTEKIMLPFSLSQNTQVQRTVFLQHLLSDRMQGLWF